MATNRTFNIKTLLATAHELLNKHAWHTTSPIPFKYKFH